MLRAMSHGSSLPRLGAALLALFTTTSAFVASVGAAECKPRCGELPAMERELFNQEFLQDRFSKYAKLDIVASPQNVPDPDNPGKTMVETMIMAMQREAAAALSAYMKSAAGGGQKGKAAPGAGTNEKCQKYTYLPNGKQIPFDEDLLRKKLACWDVDFTLAHENQHVADCQAGLQINSEYEAYAASDVRAYGAGIRALRSIIAETARRCGWEGSVNKRKKNPVDNKDEDVVPTKADADKLGGALKSAPSAGKGGRR